jgi:hypothetical protein
MGTIFAHLHVAFSTLMTWLQVALGLTSLQEGAWRIQQLQ